MRKENKIKREEKRTKKPEDDFFLSVNGVEEGILFSSFFRAFFSLAPMLVTDGYLFGCREKEKTGKIVAERKRWRLISKKTRRVFIARVWGVRV